MKLHYKGVFTGDVETLPRGERKPGAVKFKEFKSAKTQGVVCNLLGFLLLIPLFIIFVLRCKDYNNDHLLIGSIIGLLLAIPHEFLHAICFKKDVFLYVYPKGGTLFVTGPEDMSKKRFIFLSFLPNLVFGFIPFIIFCIFPNLTILGAIGLIGIPCGIGDYYNVFNALTQMPKGARTYLHGFNSYWYMP